jgi:hypothetical protein
MVADRGKAAQPTRNRATGAGGSRFLVKRGVALDLRLRLDVFTFLVPCFAPQLLDDDAYFALGRRAPVRHCDTQPIRTYHQLLDLPTNNPGDDSLHLGFREIAVDICRRRNGGSDDRSHHDVSVDQNRHRPANVILRRAQHLRGAL